LKISGYEHNNTQNDDIKFMDLAEITIEAIPEELRKIALFLNETAEKMENMGESYSHEHLADNQSGFENSPHITVFNSNNVK